MLEVFFIKITLLSNHKYLNINFPFYTLKKKNVKFHFELLVFNIWPQIVIDKLIAFKYFIKIMIILLRYK